MGNERFNETKETAVREVLAFASEHNNAAVALTAADLLTVQSDGTQLVQSAAFCLRSMARSMDKSFDALTDSAVESRDPARVRASLVALTIGSIDVLTAVCGMLAQRSEPKPARIETDTNELEGLAWVALAEEHARDGGDEWLALALVYLRGSLTGDGTCHALNLAEALARITGDSTKALQAVLEADGEGPTLTEHTLSRDAIRRAELLATGWRWLRKLAAR